MREGEAQRHARFLRDRGYVAYAFFGMATGKWLVVVDGVIDLRSEQDVLDFLQKHPGTPSHPIEAWDGVRPMERYLHCSKCGRFYSADPSYYEGRDGFLSCCGQALRLYAEEPMDHVTHLLAELVDYWYLLKPHADLYKLYPPLPLTAERMTDTYVTVRAPAIPESLQRALDIQVLTVEPQFSPEQIGYILYHAGYHRDSEGIWSQSCANPYHPFQDGDRIDFGSVTTCPFAIVKVHSVPDLYDIRYRDERAA